ncbi:hypothetical protein DUI87_31348 [Hirundo rustica rustica]|uniref:Reverse transcriptase/retrotransposon-derived protein RNase H-like domain-containing protein n=1 Tax=Hirundo rustica rustica TaxID=333673 RepID=A0A3M0ITW2_HIRRU|nr:hypothetical protein DUI87_31348 [Hirundo rustica rustica]
MLLVEEADYNLLGRDLIVALSINLIVRNSQIMVSIYKLTREDEDKINPKVWHTGKEAGKLAMEPISIEIEKPEDPIRIRQYPIPLEGRRGLKPIIEDLIKKGILEPCMSRHNTPILAIKKGDGNYRTGSNLLGAPLYETLSRRKREVKKGLPQVGGNQKWGEEEWPAERIIEYYGPATWAQDGSWGYRTPVYLLNRLIRLQAVVKIVSNHTSDALELLAKQHSQMRAFVYQNRIALDYLLAEERGVCEKFNDSECCIEINDYRETIRDLAAEI